MSDGCVAFLSVGSNLGDRKNNIALALDRLRRAGVGVTRVSSVFETEPVGVASQPWFLNIAVEVETRLPARDLLEICLETEHSLGRVRTSPGAPRIVDMDILLYDTLIVDGPSLRIPHPRMTGRRFVLEPLAQIAPDAIHPVSNMTIRDLLKSCKDPAQVHYHSELPE